MASVSASGASAESGPAAPARIERVRYEADGTSIRVVVLLSRPVPYEVNVLAGETARGSQRRVVLDFSNARLGPAATQPVGIEDGILQRIRTGQFTARTARVVLDLASVTRHSIRELANPPRVVIDVAGKTDAQPAAEAPRAPEPKRLGTAPPARRTRAESGGRRTDERTVLPDGVGPPSAEADAARRQPPAAETPSGTHPPEQAPAVAPPERRADDTTARDGAAPKDRTTRVEPVPGQPLRGRGDTPWRIVLDPGHGGNDPGARGVDGVLEKDITLAIAQRLKRRIEESVNSKVLLTRSDDSTRSLAERTAFANANSADLFISIHANADRSGELHGIETYTLNNSNDRATIRLAKMENGPGVRIGRGNLSFILSDLVQSGKEEESNALAQRLHSRVLARLRARYPDVRNLGVKRGPFYVLVGAYMPCVLIETSFLSHPIEGKRLASAEYQTEIAEGLYLGIRDFLGELRLAKTL